MEIVRMAVTLLILTAGAVWIGAVPAAGVSLHTAGLPKWRISLSFLIGSGIYMCVFAILVLFACLGGQDFAFVYRCGLVSLFVLYLLAGLTMCIKRFRRVIAESFAVMRQKDWRVCAWLLFACYLGIAGTYVLHRPLLSELFDLPERLTVLEQTGLLTGVDPLTGHASGVQFSFPVYVRSILPAWYLLLVRLSGLERWDILFKIVPFWILALCMSVHYEMGVTILWHAGSQEHDKSREARKRVLLFMCFFTIYILCGNGAYMNPPHAILHYAYEEEAVLTNVLIPAVFLCVLGLFRRGLSLTTNKE